MTVAATTHLNFRGDARAALTFYHAVFGGDLQIISYAEMGQVQEQSEADQVIWGQVAAANGFRVMAFDVLPSRPWSRGENSFFVALRGTDAEEIRGLWDKLAAGAEVLVPLAPAQWSSLYGMLQDRFGITWVVDVASEYNAA